MQISLVGISHKTAPVAVREHFAFAADELPPLLARLGQDYAGATVLSTCNRTEVYLTAARGITDPRPIVALLGAIKGDAPMEGAPFFALTGRDAARHLFRVAASVESMVIGESEILGQVRGAFTAATAAGTSTPALSRLFHSAIRVGRKVRTQTSIGRHPVSVSSTAVALARTAPGDLKGKTVLVIGAGEAGQLTASNLNGVGIGRMLVSSRSAERTADIAAALGAEPVAFERRGDALADADIVISSTAAHDAVITADMVTAAMHGRQARPLLLIDIGVPRDIDPACEAITGVELYDIDRLQAVAEKNLHLRKQEIAAAERIIDDHAAKYAEWMRSLEVVPTIASLRARAEDVRAAEVERTLAKMDLTPAERKRIESMTSAIVKKLMHDPVSRLKSPAGGERYIEAARVLFGLDDPDASTDAASDSGD